MGGELAKKIFSEKLSRLTSIVEELSLKGLILVGDSMNRWLLGKGLSSISMVTMDITRIYVPVLEYTRALDLLAGVPSVEVIAYQRYPVEVPEGFKIFSGGVEELVKRELSARGAFGCDLTGAPKRVLDIIVEKCIDLSQDLWRVRASKSQHEIEAISMAAEIASRAYTEATRYIEAGMLEMELAGEIDRALRRKGSEGYAFPTIVASGPNASYPHAEPGARAIGSEDAVVVDMGAVYTGYVSDMTRMLVGRGAGGEVASALEAVEEALERAVEKIYPGARASEVDEAARSTLERRGYGRYYIHSTGHGVGVEVHEHPFISRSSQDVIEKGYVITVEPGIYIPGKLGVRLEELVLVTEKGASILTKAPRVTYF